MITFHYTNIKDIQKISEWKINQVIYKEMRNKIAAPSAGKQWKKLFLKSEGKTLKK